MIGNSLRFRLLLGGALWIGLALIMTGAAILYLFVSNVERSIRTDLEVAAARLIALIDLDSTKSLRLTQNPADPRYDIPLSGFYWQIEEDGDEAGGETLRSRSLWDFIIAYDPPPDAAGAVNFTTPGPAGQSLSAIAQAVSFQLAGGDRAYRIIVAQDRSVLDESITKFGRDLVIALIVLGAALVAAAIAQVGLGLRPLRRLRQDIETIRTGESNAVASTYPGEVLPLVGEVNALLASQQRLIEFARTRAADLAHGLKTPLAVLGTLGDQLRDEGQVAHAALIDELVAEMGERIDYQLRLSRLRQRARTQVLSTELAEVVTRITSVLRRTSRGEGLFWSIDPGEGLALDIDRNDLVELLGVVLENAAEWARAEVEVVCRADGADALITVADDGGTLTPEDVAMLSGGDGRLDETSRGNGLGLRIAREIVALNGGRVEFSLSRQFGLSVAIRLPLAVVPRAGRARAV